jgi:hypothetical protein
MTKRKSLWHDGLCAQSLGSFTIKKQCQCNAYDHAVIIKELPNVLPNIPIASHKIVHHVLKSCRIETYMAFNERVICKRLPYKEDLALL